MTLPALFDKPGFVKKNTAMVFSVNKDMQLWAVFHYQHDIMMVGEQDTTREENSPVI